MTDTLLEDVGPNGNIQAVVESDDEVCFFYLFGTPETKLEMKSVWVRNHAPAPSMLEVKRMREGGPPQNPQSHCLHPQGLNPTCKEDLHVLWLPEGNGAALYEADEILAIIPPWSGIHGFSGYARDCVGQGPVAWELSKDNVLLHRFEDARAYWKRWDDKDLWHSIQADMLSKIEQRCGQHSKYYAIDGGQWPPKALVRIPREVSILLITVGLSTRPQPNVEMFTEDPQPLRRIELGVILPSSWSEGAIKNFAGYLSGLSNLPWNSYSWLGPGHTVQCSAWQNPDFDCALLIDDHPAAGRLSLGPQFDDPVNVLWLIPITEAERQTAIDKGSDHLLASLSNVRWPTA